MKVPNDEETMKKCICMNCPSHNECMKGKMEGFFCAKDKATCEFDKVGCVCGECPITGEFQLSGGYWCEAGIAE